MGGWVGHPSLLKYIRLGLWSGDFVTKYHAIFVENLGKIYEYRRRNMEKTDFFSMGPDPARNLPEFHLNPKQFVIFTHFILC